MPQARRLISDDARVSSPRRRCGFPLAACGVCIDGEHDDEAKSGGALDNHGRRIRGCHARGDVCRSLAVDACVHRGLTRARRRGRLRVRFFTPARDATTVGVAVAGDPVLARARRHARELHALAHRCRASGISRGRAGIPADEFRCATGQHCRRPRPSAGRRLVRARPGHRAVPTTGLDARTRRSEAHRDRWPLPRRHHDVRRRLQCVLPRSADQSCIRDRRSRRRFSRCEVLHGYPHASARDPRRKG